MPSSLGLFFGKMKACGDGGTAYAQLLGEVTGTLATISTKEIVSASWGLSRFLLQHGLAGAQPRLPGPEFQGRILETKFLTGLPRGS